MTTNPIPQADGVLHHRRFADGTEIELAVALWETPNDIACGETRRTMHEMLVAHLDAILNGPGRLYWQPSGYGDLRMLESARWLEPIEVSYESGVPICTFTIDSPFPYVMDVTERRDDPEGSPGLLIPSGTGTITLPTYSAAFWPVIKVYPDALAWSIINTSVTDEYGDQLLIYFDGARAPGSGNIPNPHYAEIDTFRETIYYDGNQANLKPYIDPEATDYFYLKPGANVIEANNCDALFLINNAWVVG